MYRSQQLVWTLQTPVVSEILTDVRGRSCWEKPQLNNPQTFAFSQPVKRVHGFSPRMYGYFQVVQKAGHNAHGQISVSFLRVGDCAYIQALQNTGHIVCISAYIRCVWVFSLCIWVFPGTAAHRTHQCIFRVCLGIFLVCVGISRHYKTQDTLSV